jgi:hypothetical protein
MCERCEFLVITLERMSELLPRWEEDLDLPNPQEISEAIGIY